MELFTTRSGHMRGTAKDKIRDGVWSGEVSSPLDLKKGPITRQPGTPEDSGPATKLYHNNKKYMGVASKPRRYWDQIPPLIPPASQPGANWEFIKEETTPNYGDIEWKVGDIYSVMDDFMFEPGTDYDFLCSYWQAISIHIYNSPEYWMWVKAQHLEFLARVLPEPTHPRHSHYSLLNSQFRQMPSEYKRIAAPSLRREMAVSNLWQTLLIPKQFVSHFMLQVTADLYSIYLVLFLHTNMEEDYLDYTPDFAARGDWKERHCALRLNSHLCYEPLIPKELDAATYKLERVTFDKYPDAKAKAWRRGAEWHPLLCDFETESAPQPLNPKTVVGKVGQNEIAKVLWVEFTDEDGQSMSNGGGKLNKRKR